MSMNIRTSKDYIAAASADSSKLELSQLSKSRVASVRRRVAENCGTPAELLKNLACDNDSRVRIAVGLNRSTELSIVMKLIYDENPDVRFCLASASYLPARLLYALTKDANPYVVDRAHRTLERRQDNARTAAPNIFEFLHQDHLLVVGKLEQLLRYHSNGSHNNLKDQIVDAIDSVRQHFEQQHKCCLDLISSSEYSNVLLPKCTNDQRRIIKAIDALWLTDVDDVDNFSCALKELISSVAEHIRFAETDLFKTVQRHVTPSELTQMNHMANYVMQSS